MSWFKELTSKAEAVLVKLDQNAAQALQNPTGIPSDFSYSGPESNVRTHQTRDFLDQNNPIELDTSSDNVIDPNIQHEILKPHCVTPETTSNSKIIPSSEPILNLAQPNKTLSQTTPGDIRIEAQEKKRVQVEEPVEQISFRDSEIDTTKSIGHSKNFTIQTSRAKSNLFSEINTRHNNGITRSDKEKSKRNAELNPIPNLGADDIRASINQTLQEYSNTYLSSKSVNLVNWQDSNQRSSHFDDLPFIVHDDDLDCFLKRRNSALSCSIDFPDDNGVIEQKTDITARLLQQNISKRKSAFNLQRVINKLANTHASEYIVFGDQKRVKLRRFKLRLATYVRRLNYYFHTHPNMKYYALGYVVLMQLLVVYVLFFYQSTPSPNEFTIQINKQLQDAETVIT